MDEGGSSAMSPDYSGGAVTANPYYSSNAEMGFYDRAVGKVEVDESDYGVVDHEGSNRPIGSVLSSPPPPPPPRGENHSVGPQATRGDNYQGLGEPTSEEQAEREWREEREHQVRLLREEKGSKAGAGKMSGKQLICRVVLLDGENAEIPLANPSKATGEDLFNAVVEKINLEESDFFGLNYTDTHKNKIWLQPQKVVKEQLPSGVNPVFEFEVKFYPPDPGMLAFDFTRWLLCLQVRQDMLGSRTPCSFMTLAVMGSYTVQSEVGDFDPSQHHTIDYLKQYNFAPNQSDELLDRIMDLHKQHKGLLPAESDGYFLDNAKKLALYGMDMWPVKSETRGSVNLGISASGVYVYDGRLRVDSFKWPRILKVSYKRNLFFIKVRPGELDKHEKTSTFKGVDPKYAKRLWRLVVESHQFFRLKSPELTDTRTLGFGTKKWRLSTRTLDQMKSAKTLPRRLNAGSRTGTMQSGGYGTIGSQYGTERFDPNRSGELAEGGEFNGGTMGRDYDASQYHPGGPGGPGGVGAFRQEEDLHPSQVYNASDPGQLPDTPNATMERANMQQQMYGPNGGMEDEQSMYPGGVGELAMPLFASESAGVSADGILDLTAGPLSTAERGEKFMTEKDGYVEKRVQHKITLTSEDGDINFDQALLDAIQMVTNMDPNLTVEKIEIKTEDS